MIAIARFELTADGTYLTWVEDESGEITMMNLHQDPSTLSVDDLNAIEDQIQSMEVDNG